MPTTSDLSVLTLITQASVVVQIVMAGLVLASLVSWYTIFRKHFGLSSAMAATRRFEHEFWSGGDLAALLQRAQQRKGRDGGPLERIFEAGLHEFMKVRTSRPGDPGSQMDGARRAMRATYQREMDALERKLPFLASVGSVSPYVGLFGTVWGIMNAFRGLANVQQATLAHVAPGIAEALIATAIGLFAAIPATVAYNRFVADSDRLANRFETFMDEFSNILQRQTR
ncbi:MAG TPA: protein TolQ [Burkholderiaceae bacterium]|nr:protein TolQ [Burkholderiaceae bacterium]